MEKVAKAKAKTTPKAHWQRDPIYFGGHRLPGSLGQEKKEINLLYLFIFVFSDFLSLLNTLFMCLALLCRENVTGSQFPSVFL